MNATGFCKHVEATLGWEAPAAQGWKTYAGEAAKVKRKIATNPELYTWDNLLLAVELLRREKKSRTPVGVFAHVDRALDLALDHEYDVETQIREVVAHETAIGDPNGWVIRFARATGDYRRQALQEWKEATR